MVIGTSAIVATLPGEAAASDLLSLLILRTGAGDLRAEARMAFGI